MELQLHETFDSNASRKETDGQSTSRKSPSHMAAPLDLSFKSYVSSAGKHKIILKRVIVLFKK